MDINQLMALKLQQIEQGNAPRPETLRMLTANEQPANNALPASMITPDAMKQSYQAQKPVVEKEHALDLGTTKQAEVAQPQAQQNNWVQDILKAIPGIAKGAVEFGNKPAGMKTFAALNADPYMKEALLNRGNEMQKTQEAEDMLRTKAKIENETIAQKAALNPYADTPIQSFDKEGNPVAVYMPIPQFAGLMNPKIIPLGDVQKEIPKPSISSDYILPGESEPRPMNTVNGRIIDPKTKQDVTNVAKVYVKPEKPKTEPKLKTLPASAVTDIADMKDSMDMLTDFDNSMTALYEKDKGLFNPITAVPRVVASNFTKDTDARLYASQITLLKQIIAKGLEGGVLRQEDTKKYNLILGSPGADIEAIKGISENIRKRIANKIQRREEEYSDAGYKVNGSTPDFEIGVSYTDDQGNQATYLGDGEWEE